MSRILWMSNAPWAPSGYGEQTAMFVPRLRLLGHDLAVACNFGLNGTKLDWQGLTCYPADGNWGNTTLATFAGDHQADLTIALCDAWVLKPHEWPDNTRAAVWAPIDHYPIPPAVLAVLAHPNIAPIAMSRFGENLMQQAGLAPLYVPHGVDTSVFYPRREIRDQVRDELGIPRDAFLAGMVSANKGNPACHRKSFPQAFHAFSRFAADHEDAFLYVHTDPNPGGHGGISLDQLAVATGCPPDRVRFPPGQAWHLGMNNSVVAALYQAFDVLLSPSMGEGFGIPILEAQACGVPVIASDHSAMTELTQAGWLVGGDPWWDSLQASFFIVPAIDGILAALEASYEKRDDVALRESAAAFARGYDADLVTVEHWEPALEVLLRPREVPPLNLNGNRAMRRAAKRGKVAA